MPRSGTFKIVFTIVLVLGATVGAAYGLAHYLTTQAPVTLVPVAQAAPVASRLKPAAAVANVGQPVLFTLRAGVSTDDGPTVSIEFEPAAGACEEPRWLDVRNVHSVKPTEPLKVESEASWCLQLAPGQLPTSETLPGKWVTLGDRFLELDAAHQYMRVQHASGRWLSLRAVAAGYCATESSACSGTALVEVSIDDQNILVPLVLSSKVRDVLRLTSGAELDRISQAAQAAAAARQAARDAENADGLEAEDMTESGNEEDKPKIDPSYSEVVL